MGSNYTTHSQIGGVSYADSVATLRHQDGKEQYIRSTGVLNSNICRQQLSIRHISGVGEKNHNNFKNGAHFSIDTKRWNSTTTQPILFSQPLLSLKKSKNYQNKNESIHSNNKNKSSIIKLYDDNSKKLERRRSSCNSIFMHDNENLLTPFIETSNELPTKIYQYRQTSELLLKSTSNQSIINRIN